MAELNISSGEISPAEVHIHVDELANSMSEELREVLKQNKGYKPIKAITIFKIPEYIRRKHEELYKPQIISIGPYHRGAKPLEPMEEQKWRSLQQLLQETAQCNLSELVKNVRSLEAKARSAYKVSDESLPKGDEFVKMMVLDACFIIQFLSELDHEKVASDISALISDLLLLENQIPFFIIRSLYSKFFPNKQEKQLYSLLANLMFTAADFRKLDRPAEEPVHLVHLYYKWFIRTARAPRILPGPPRIQPLQPSVTSPVVPAVKVTTTSSIKVIPSATTLREAGVKFKRRTSYRDLFHVTFSKGVIEISSIILDNKRKRLLLNLIALEQGQVEWKKDLTSFAKLMDMLIDTPKDVAILEKCGILHNHLASREEATRFFNQICECAAVDYNNNYLAQLIQQVQEFNDSKWHRCRAMLRRDYFSSPWSILSLIAAIMLLILTFLQVFFAIYSKH